MNFVTEMLRMIEDDAEFINLKIFFDDVCFHLSFIVHGHNVRILGPEIFHAYCEVQKEFPKINLWCRLMHDFVTGPLFFIESTLTSALYIDMLENFILPDFIQNSIKQILLKLRIFLKRKPRLFVQENRLTRK